MECGKHLVWRPSAANTHVEPTAPSCRLTPTLLLVYPACPLGLEGSLLEKGTKGKKKRGRVMTGRNSTTMNSKFSLGSKRPLPNAALWRPGLPGSRRGTVCFGCGPSIHSSHHSCVKFVRKSICAGVFEVAEKWQNISRFRPASSCLPFSLICSLIRQEKSHLLVLEATIAMTHVLRLSQLLKGD